MEPRDVLEGARDAISVKRVFGEPIERNGVTVIPAARVMGGAGGGSGPASEGKDDAATAGPTAPMGVGLGFGMMAGPAGAYVIKGDQVSWQPAYDVQRLTLIGGVIAIAVLLVIRSIVRSFVDAR